MGSFDVTCSLSGLPIQVGDPVYFLFLSKYDSFLELMPFSAPILATCEDCGNVSFTPNTSLLGPLLQELASLDQEKFKKALPYTEHDATNLEQLIRAAYRGNLVVQGTTLVPALISSPAWEYLSTRPRRSKLTKPEPGDQVGAIFFEAKFPGQSGQHAASLIDSDPYSEIDGMDRFLNVQSSVLDLSLSWKPSYFAGQEHKWKEIANWHLFLSDVAEDRK